ncbi:MAG: DUF882 domain-containing protein [Polyangia bacterium]
MLGAAPAAASTVTHAGATSAPAAAKKKRKKHRSAGGFSGSLAPATELRSEPAEKPTGHLVLTAVNFSRETVDVQLYRADGSFDPDALDQLNHAFRCRRTQTEKAIEPHLFEMLSRIYDHFGKPLELVSGFRNQERVTSFHFHGSASDIRIPGVSEHELHKFVTSLDAGGMGIGLYPRAGFIHVDIRPEASYRWTDYSPPGQSDSVARGTFINHKKHGKKARPAT